MAAALLGGDTLVYASREVDRHGVSLFHRLPLSDEDRHILRTLFFIRKNYRAQSDIAKEGDEADRIFLVRKGWTALYRISSDGERQIIDFPVPGDVVGLHGSKGGFQPSFMALTDATVYETSATSLIATVMRSESLTELLFDEGARQRAIVIEHLANLGRRSALSRVAHLFLELKTRLSAVGSGGPDGYECPLTQYDLADALALTAIHVNRMLRELRQSDLLHFHKGYVGILNQAGLAALAGFEPSYLAPKKTRIQIM